MNIRSIVSKIKYEAVVFGLFVFSRLPDLGNDIFNTDTWKWKARIFDFGQGVFTGNFEMTIQRYHPGVILMWLGSVGVKLYNLYYDIFIGHPPSDNDINTVFELHFVQKLVIILAIAMTVSVLFYFLRILFNLRLAFIFVLLLIFEPFYIALTRVIHLEGLMSTFMLTSFVVYFYLLVTSQPGDGLRTFIKRKAFVVSAFFAALAVLTKTSSLFIFPIVGLMSLVEFYTNSRDGKLLKAFSSTIKLGFIWFLYFALFFIVLWPGMWVAPGKALYTLYEGIFITGVEEGHEQLYFGKLVQDPGPSFYFVVLGFRSSIYLLVGLLGTFYLLLANKIGNLRLQKFVKYTLLFSVLYMIFMTIPSKKLDRYLLPSILGFLMCSAVFFDFVSQKFVTWAKQKLVSKVWHGTGLKILSAVFFIPAIWTAATLHPDYFSYYNPLLGGLKVGINIIEPKWIIGHHEAVRYLEQSQVQYGLEDFKEEETLDILLHRSALKKKVTVGVPEKYYTQIWPFIRKAGGWAVITNLTGQANRVNFFLYPVWDDYSNEEKRFKVEYIGTVKMRGVPVYNVYKRIF